MMLIAVINNNIKSMWKAYKVKIESSAPDGLGKARWNSKDDQEIEEEKANRE